MALIQQPARTPEEIAASAPLTISPAEVATFDEAEWYARAFRGDDAPQLTVRALAMGSILGFFLAFTNLYVGLKTGWHLGIAITACLLSFSIWTAMLKTGLAKTPMSILENNCMQSTASAAGYSTGGTMVSAIAALLILSATPENPGGEHLPWPVLTAWTALLAVLGVTLAIPMKRNMINRERLKFPSGLAAAVTLQSMYASGAEALRKGRAVAIAALLAATVPLLIDLNARTVTTVAGTRRTPLVQAHVDLFNPLLPSPGADRTTGQPFSPSEATITWDVNPVMIAAGMLVGLRTTFWMLVAALLLVYAVGPFGYDAAWIAPDGSTAYATTHPAKAWKEIGLWLGAPIMVASGLLSFALQGGTIVRAFQGMGGGGSTPDSDAVRAVEVPMSWFAVGGLVSGAGVVVLAWYAFGIPLHLGALAVALTFALSLVAARATGETDITPTGAMGKIMQLIYGVLIPQSATANLMTAGITSGAAFAAADLLNDLKSGYLLGAHPRRQLLAQGAGIVTGTAATVIGFYILVPDATALTGKDGSPPAFPAPAAQSWRAVAEVFQNGIETMHPVHQQAIVVGLCVGAVITLLESMLPAARRYLPSATGLGLGFVLPALYPISMFAGAVLAWAWERADADHAESYVVPVSSGIIAGVSIVGVIVAALNNLALS